MQIVIFELGGRQYGIKTEQVEEISKILEVTPVPKAPHYIKGLINLRGNIMSLIDLTQLLSMENTEEKFLNIIVVKVEEEMLGILVGQVKEVVDIEVDDIEKVTLKGEELKGVKGIIQLGEHIINFLDLEQCFLD